ncbi:MAG: T9SS type A sorting domain-containing protein [Bacteroidia bacterium]|nr:T9SS type A sorting domain-containing protein [Bacteroidia bacterium]
MNKFKFYITLYFLVIISVSYAQDKRNEQFDVINYSINLNIRNISAKKISGNTDIKIKSVQNNLSKIIFDLAKLKVDSIFISQNKQNFTQNDSQLFVNLQSTLNLNDTIILNIFYQGTPTKDPSWGGFYFTSNYAFNMGVGFNVNPHNYGRVWFPCVDNFTDRSTYDFHITTDSSYMAVCNGLPKATTINSDNSITWNWQLNQPIPTYLACVAISNYTPVKFTFAGKSKNFDVILAAIASDTVKVKASMINLPKALQFFEEKFSNYPFERAGYVMVPFSGGAMEHATCITYPLFGVDGTLNYETLMAHELSHMWWGNMVTCESESEMWLNEGWASFCEALFLELMYGKDAFYNDMNEKLLLVMRSAHIRDGGFLVLNQIPHQVTYGDHVYKKGALTVTALRYFMGDIDFYKACNSYLNKYKFQSSNSVQLRNEFQKFTAVNLTNFFNEWVFTAGGVAIEATSYKVITNNGANSIALNIRQHARANNLLYQYIPFKITAFNKNGDRFVYIDSLKSYEKQIVFILPLNFIPEFILVNENNELPLAKTYNLQTIKGTGIKTFTDGLLSINIQQNTDSATVLAEHYWVGAMQYEVAPKGIRISNYRFWNIDGSFDNTKLKGQCYFNYDGTTPTSATAGHLDHTLPFTNEDSLVLLFKAPGTNTWVIHTDNTRISGGNKTDKIGRFTTNKIEKGMYAFGVNDYKVGIINLDKFDKKETGFILFPNPTNHLLNIEISENLLNSKATIFNTSGKEFQSILLTKTSQSINIDYLTKGTYYFKIYNNINTQTKSFIVN